MVCHLSSTGRLMNPQLLFNRPTIGVHLSACPLSHWTLVPALVLLVPWAETAVYCPRGFGAGRLGVFECWWQRPAVLVVEGRQRHLPSGVQPVAHHVSQGACCPVPTDGSGGRCADAAEEEGEVGARHLIVVQQPCRHQAAVHVSPVGPLVGVEAEVL